MLTLPAQDVVEFDEFMDKVCKSNGMYASPFKMSGIMRELEDLSYWRQNRVVSGGIFSAPTSASTQASGAVPAVWRVKLDSYISIKNGLMYKAGGTGVDVAIDNIRLVTLPALAVGQSIVAAFVGISYMNGLVETPSYQAILGTPATTGTEQPPTDAEIEAFLANDNDLPGYIRIAKLTLNRTGDTTVTQTQDNTWRDA